MNGLRKMKKNTDINTQSPDNNKNKDKEDQEWKQKILDRMGMMRDENGQIVSKPQDPNYTTLY